MTRRLLVWVSLLSRVVSSGSALIGNSSPLSKSSSSSNYIPFPSSVLVDLALFLLFLLGSAADHRPHTPTTNPVQLCTISLRRGGNRGEK